MITALLHRKLLRGALLGAAALGLWLESGTTGAAQGLDMGRATCADFSGLSNLDQHQISLWLAGYYAGNAQRPLLDPAGLPDVAKRLIDMCAKTPEVPLIGAETRPVFLLPPKQ